MRLANSLIKIIKTILRIYFIMLALQFTSNACCLTDKLTPTENNRGNPLNEFRTFWKNEICCSKQPLFPKRMKNHKMFSVNSLG